MVKTLDTLVDECRLLLKDRRIPFRYTQPDLISAINTAFIEVKRVRPDAFLAHDNYIFSSTPLPVFVEADVGKDPPTPLPIDDIFYIPVMFHIVGKLQLADDEFAVDNRAMTLLTSFHQMLRGG